MKKVALFFLVAITNITTNAQDSARGFGLHYADSATIANQKYVVPRRSLQGLTQTDKIEMLDEFPPVDSQGEIGSCASWATVYAMRSYIEKRKQGYSYYLQNGTFDGNTVFSPLFIFNQVKDNDKRCDSVGSEIGKNLQRIKDIGVCKYQTFYPHPYKYPCCDLNPMENQFAVQEASNFKIDDFGWAIRDGGFYASGQKLNIIKNFLLQKYPVILGINIDSSFWIKGGQLAGSKYIWQKPQSDDIGSHAVVCIGFNKDLRAIQVYNSWGPGWANKGIGYISYDLIDSKVFEAYIVNPGADIVWVPGNLMQRVATVHSQDENNEHLSFEKKFLHKSETNFFITNRFQPYNNIRIMPVKIDVKNQQAVFKIYEMKNGHPFEIDVFVLKPTEIYKFTNSGVEYNFNFLNINRWKGLFSKFAANYLIKAN